MQNQHARVGSALGNDILVENGTLVSGSVGTKGLDNWVDVVVNRLGHANDNNLATVFGENVFGELSSLCVGVVTSNGVQAVDFVLNELLSGNFEGSFSFLNESAGEAVLNVCELRQMEREEGVSA